MFNIFQKIATVGICIYIVPLICLLSTCAVLISILLRVIKGPGRLLSMCMFPSSVGYLYFYAVETKYFFCFQGHTILDKYHYFQQALLEIATRLDITYLELCLVIYGFMVPSIILVNLLIAKLAFPKKKIKKFIKANTSSKFNFYFL